MEEVRLKYCDVYQESASVSLKRTSGGPIYIQIPRCTSTGPTSSQFCSMGVRHGQSPRPCLNAWTPSTPGACVRSYEYHISGTLQNYETVRSITDCSPVSERVKYFRLKFFRHLARSAQEEDHHRVISAALRPPSDLSRPIGRPRTTWLRTIDEDIQPQNFGVHTAWRKARDREVWHQVVSTELGVRHQKEKGVSGAK